MFFFLLQMPMYERMRSISFTINQTTTSMDFIQYRIKIPYIKYFDTLFSSTEKHLFIINNAWKKPQKVLQRVWHSRKHKNVVFLLFRNLYVRVISSVLQF